MDEKTEKWGLPCPYKSKGLNMNGPLLPTPFPTRRGDVASPGERGSDRFKGAQGCSLV